MPGNEKLLANRSTLDIGVLGYISIVQHKEHSPEILSIPPGTPCITYNRVCHPVEFYRGHPVICDLLFFVFDGL